MFLAAHTQFKDQSYLDVAHECGEVVWNRGILLKGNGLCHGITGNMYALMTLAKATSDLKWYVRAHLFAKLSFNPEVYKLVGKAPDRQRKVSG